MVKVVGVRFRKPGKIYFFDPGNLDVRNGDEVIVETALGQEYGTVTVNSRNLPDEKVKKDLKNIIRIANKEDRKHQQENLKNEKKAFDICQKKIKEHKLKMNLVEARYLFDNSKLLFYFTADGRIDFRDLVKDLASVFRTRIELRQIGVRDEIKRMGGNGPCGRELCCCSFLKKLDVVTIKMAKEQNLSLNASKITGSCGRLMCCLKYEQNVYEDKLKKLPKLGAIVSTDEGEGTVEGIEVLNEVLKVKLKDNEDNFYYKKYNASDVKVIKDGKKEVEQEVSEEDLKELEQMEKMDKMEINSSNDDEM